MFHVVPFNDTWKPPDGAVATTVPVSGLKPVPVTLNTCVLDVLQVGTLPKLANELVLVVRRELIIYTFQS